MIIRHTVNCAAVIIASLSVLMVCRAAEVACALPPLRVIHGKVVDTDGHPLENAEVYCQSGYYPAETACSTARSSKDGSFSIAELPNPSCPRMHRYEVSLWAWTPGHGIGMQDVPSDEHGSEAGVRLVCGAPHNFNVRVTNPDGSPIDKAIVKVVAFGEGLRNVVGFGLPESVNCMPDVLASNTSVKTDGQGNAILSAWPPKNRMLVSVSTPQFGCQRFMSLEDRDTPDRMEIQLRPVGRLTGRVVADHDVALEGLTVRIELHSKYKQKAFYSNIGYFDDPNTETSSDLPHMLSVITAKTDSEGRFDIPNAPYGWVDFRIPELLGRPYQLPHAFSAQRLKEFHEGDATPFELKLEPAVHVRGRLCVMYTKMLPSDFDVFVYNNAFCTFYTAIPVSADGYFDCYLQSGPVKWILRSHHTTPMIGPSFNGAGAFVLRPGTKEDNRLVFRVMEIRGRIVDKAGKPAAGVNVTCLNGGELMESDAAGRFRFLAFSGNGGIASVKKLCEEDKKASEENRPFNWSKVIEEGLTDPWEDMTLEIEATADDYHPKRVNYKIKSLKEGVVPEIQLDKWPSDDEN